MNGPARAIGVVTMGLVVAAATLSGCSCGDEDGTAAPAKDAAPDAPADSPPDASPDDAAPEAEATTDSAEDAAMDAPPDVADVAEEPLRCLSASCDINATCDDSTGSIVCTCLPGFAGNGLTCVEVATSLDGLRWELPCLMPLTDPFCTTEPLVSLTATLGGQASATYDVVLRFRGVVEEKTYVDGTQDGYWQIGGTPGSDPYNAYSLVISDPPQTYYLNAGLSIHAHCFEIDYERTVQAKGSATFRLDADATDAEQVENVDDMGVPIVIPGVAPDPAAFDGQVIQMDVVSVTPR